MRGIMSFLSMLTSEKAQLMQDNSVLHAKVAEKEKQLSQYRKEMEALCGIATEILADLKEAREEVARTQTNLLQKWSSGDWSAGKLYEQVCLYQDMLVFTYLKVSSLIYSLQTKLGCVGPNKKIGSSSPCMTCKENVGVLYYDPYRVQNLKP